MITTEELARLIYRVRKLQLDPRTRASDAATRFLDGLETSLDNVVAGILGVRPAGEVVSAGGYTIDEVARLLAGDANRTLRADSAGGQHQ